MRIKKDLVVVALAIFCLTATVFMIRPTKSNPGTTIEPNQWADINDDGTVDIYDAIILSNAFGQPVDPVKNVNVTDYPGLNSYASYYSYNNSFFGINQDTFANYRELQVILNCSWNQYINPGLGWVGSAFTIPISVRGFSRIYLYTTATSPSNATSGNYSVTHKMSVFWNVAGTEIDSNVGNITIRAENGNTFYYTSPPMKYFREVKGPSIQISIDSNSTDLPGWMLYTLDIYLRNE